MIRISVVIPTCNRPEPLYRCLEALAVQRLPLGTWETIVVDDGSEPPLEQGALEPLGGAPATLLRQENRGPSAARNAGATQARGEWLALTDDDCRPDPDWLPALLARFEAHPDRLLGGRTVNGVPGNLCAETSQVILNTAYGYYNRNPDDAHFFASNNLALPARQYAALGGFDPAFRCSEDRDLCDRWARVGYGMTYAPEAVVRHCPALSLKGLWRQHFGYGCGAFHYHAARESRGSGKFRPDLSFYRRVFTAPFRPGQRGGLVLLGLLVYAQVANLAGFLAARREARRRSGGG